MSEVECPECHKESEDHDWYQVWGCAMGREIKYCCPKCGWEDKNGEVF